MTVRFRHYNHSEDYARVSDFLIEYYRPANLDANWVEPAWEYMHFHPGLNESVLEKIGIWEDNGKIAAVANYEGQLGEAFFQFDPAYHHLYPEMLAYAEENLWGQSEDGRKYLRAYISDMDSEFLDLVKRSGYEQIEWANRPMYQFEMPEVFPSITVPDGYRVKSLADECDWAKVHRVMWRGFNHDGEPPAGDDEFESRRKMFDTPKARMDLKIVVEAPNGDFASICGMFYEAKNQYAYVEPVATDPSYRRLGLGKAAVLEGIRRCQALGATVAYVGSDQAFYQAMGFKKSYISECWQKYL